MNEALPELERRLKCERFLYREADLLDNGKLHKWLELLTDDIEYRVPRRVTRERGSDQSTLSDEAFLYREDRGTIETRVKRYDKEYAWAENPPTRTRRIVSNVRVTDTKPEETSVKNNTLIYRNFDDDAEYDLIACERRDTIRQTDDGLRLAERIVQLDQTVLGTKNLSFFL